ncbi:spore coat putative kinase YutH [Aquibacillus sediminis]|uniref:spore coat putative kinase YutH n=1 Tax=Aquibacillus sediminis TaxID=2574734 RepID=UPI001485E10E|nr:spore coat protein YutH [Aquibacillus sediminis]
MELLKHYVPYFNGRKTTINGYDGYTDGNNVYFIIPIQYNEEIYYEQKAISDFLKDNGIEMITSPMLNTQNQIATHQDEQDFIVYHQILQSRSFSLSHGQSLATFHQKGVDYPYQPNYISSYGQWKTLWINKVEAFETIYQQQYRERPVSPFQRLFIDTFPYIIGLSENAIQYLQETEQEQRFDHSDRPTITFQRYHDHMRQQMIWSDDLVYDHPIRDLAEHIRFLLLQDDDRSFEKVRQFIADYEQVQPLSIFSWRLLYARLLFPIHLYDFIEKTLASGDQRDHYKTYNYLLENQAYYEQTMKNFFRELNIDSSTLHIPVLDW